MLWMGCPSLPLDGCPKQETASRNVMFSLPGRDEAASSDAAEAEGAMTAAYLSETVLFLRHRGGLRAGVAKGQAM
jgi:hypothetical protein